MPSIDSKTRSGASQITIGEGASQIVIGNDQQLQDASMKIERDQFEHKTQQSSKAVKYVITGLEAMFDISIADITLPSIANLFFGSTLETETTPSAIESDANFELVKQKIEVSDFAGTEITGQKVVIKPYPLLTEPPAKPVLGDAVDQTGSFTLDYNGVTYTAPTAVEVLELAEDVWSTEITAYNTWVSRWITFPNGALVDINGTDLAFGLETQQEIKLSIRSLPDENGVRIIFGDETIV